ncbi:TPA: hypothetical protein WLY73_000714 [Neisseria gonorrhoeae]|uniref:hypothetical protein n=1 Tax=Neisseria gonorrhoeae TaxID=485 RepID=UPI00053BC04C|nr:hypothetical protein [Neisseria gonorrhoeae]MCC9031731.1 hypothetical protein [Neisseria gonorrhoeae]MCS0641104.1 hypothetical protein [Neisseria gonorrhoeae]MDO5994352.1 hypothetical protein [Neisseria gonorrhoeae]MDO6002516.1 hypothetical protein [Neisseria gonorrhoeae]MDO6013135.1 hypothetical protein [Neisseria gonorrhoeae]
MKVSQSAMNKLVIAVIASMGLTACAGGGSDSSMSVQPSVSEQLKDNANVDAKDEKVIEYLKKSSLKDVPKELQAKVLKVKGDEYTGVRKQYAGKLGKGESVKAMLFLDGEEPFSKEQLQKMDVYVNGKKYEGSKGGVN